jgi:hypothetical protein
MAQTPNRAIAGPSLNYAPENAKPAPFKNSFAGGLCRLLQSPLVVSRQPVFLCYCTDKKDFGYRDNP